MSRGDQAFAPVPAGGSLVDLTAGEQAQLVAAREVSPVELLEASLARIAVVEPALHPFAELWADHAADEARAAADELVRRSPRGPLHGVPVAVKETSPVAGRAFTQGSLTQRATVATRDAAVVAALRRAGAVIVGATTSPEFAHAGITDSPLHGATRNPWRVERTPGGSSGGSAVAVATRCVAVAEGSDMGGSVRIPAAWTGIVGLKPGLGRIPLDVLPGGFDTISHHGPLARTVDDARIFLAATQGPDDADVFSVVAPVDLSTPLCGPGADDAVLASLRGMRFAFSTDLGGWAVHPEIAAAVERAAAALETAGAVVEQVDPGLGGDDEWVWIRLWGVFMAAYYGDHADRHPELLDPDVVRLIELGRSLSAVDLKRLEIDRTSVWQRIAAVLRGRSALLCPTMAQPAGPATKADERVAADAARRARTAAGDGYDARYHAPDMTAVFNLVSPCPALSVPCGVHAAPEHAGLPIGLQVVGHRWRDDDVLRIGRAVEVVLPEAARRWSPEVLISAGGVPPMPPTHP